MTSVVLLLIIVLASILCVRVGSIALELTGMDPEKASFQALSAFTTTGFTTKETEEITQFLPRRRIVSALILLGHVGSVSVIATLATSLIAKNPVNLLVNLALLSVGLFFIYKLASIKGVTKKLTNRIRHSLEKRNFFRISPIEEMLHFSEGYGVVRILLSDACPYLDKPLDEVHLKQDQVLILASRRETGNIMIPGGKDVLKPSDELICYGKIDVIQNTFKVFTPPIY